MGSIWPHVLLVIGTIGLWAAIYTGDLAESIVSRQICDPTVLKAHETNAYVGGWIFSAASALIILSYYGLLRKMKNLIHIAVVILSLVGSGFLIYTGHLGASLVYQQAAGVHIPSDDCSEFAEENGLKTSLEIQKASLVRKTDGRREQLDAILADKKKRNKMKNVFGEPLQSCCTDPLTGYFRDGYCKTDASDEVLIRSVQF